MRGHLLLLLLSIGLYHCSVKPQSVAAARSSGEHRPAPAMEIDSALFLENRLPNCDSALAFTKQLIQPLAAYPDVRIMRLRIPGEKDGLWANNHFRLYLAPACLIGLSSQRFYELFCPPGQIAAFQFAEHGYAARGKPFPIILESGHGFYVTVYLRSGTVEQFTVYDPARSTH